MQEIYSNYSEKSTDGILRSTNLYLFVRAFRARNNLDRRIGAVLLGINQSKLAVAILTHY